MNDKTIVTYETANHSITFQYGDGLWPFGISEILGASSVDVSLIETQGVGQIGSSISSRQIQPRSLTVSGYLLGDIAGARSQLLRTVLPGVQAKITVDLGGDKYYVDGEPINTPEITNGLGVQNFQFSFKCPYPYWKTSETALHAFRVLQKNFKFPFFTGGSWYITNYIINDRINARNEGNAAVGVSIHISAIAQSAGPIRITNVTTGAYLEFSTSFAKGDFLALSTEQQNRYCEGFINGSPVIGYRYLSFGSDLRFSLVPGDNILQVTAPSGIQTLEISLQAPRGVVTGV